MNSAIIVILLGILASIALVTVITDLTLFLYEWQSRIGIGRWTDVRKWRHSIEKTARKWLKRTPIVPLRDYRSYLLPRNILTRTKSTTIQAWQVGGLLLGLDESDAFDFMKRHPKLFSSAKIEVEFAFIAYALKTKGLLITEDERIVLNRFQEFFSAGTVPYREVSNRRFVDTIGLLCPFLSVSGHHSDAIRQIGEYENALYNGVFPFHAFDFESSLPLGACDWGRGVGWYIWGIIETEGNEERILRLADQMIKLQKPQGGFGCFLFDPEARVESSGTVMAGLLFLKAFQLSSNSIYLDAARKVEIALMKMTRRNGVVDYAQGDTQGIMGYSRRFDRMPFVQGMTLLLSKRLMNYS